MDRQERNREDLLRAASALVERAEFHLPGYPEPVVVGYRSDGSASFFFGEQYVFQFNTRKQLRRAYCDGQLLKAEAGRLASLRRNPGASEVVLERHDLSDGETASLIDRVSIHLTCLAQQLQAGKATSLRQIPVAADISGRTIEWLASLDEPIAIASAPNVS